MRLSSFDQTRRLFSSISSVNGEDWLTGDRHTAVGDFEREFGFIAPQTGDFLSFVADFSGVGGEVLVQLLVARFTR
tara:strand:- start:548 stop:775 length:228 start_codon:yes stop_codon:yes gene_type:complete